VTDRVRVACTTLATATALIVSGPIVPAQDAQPATREALIESAQAAKVPTLRPYEASAAERWTLKAQEAVLGGNLRWHPFFDSAYSGGGFTLGAGYRRHVSAYNTIDVRGSYTFKDYKRIEAEFIAPRLFHRRGELTAVGGWREATQVGFYGIGTDTSKENRTNYAFQQPYASALLTVRPTRKYLMVRGGVEWSQWAQEPGSGSFPTVETSYTPATLPGMSATVDYLHTQATVGFDSRRASGYSRRGTFVGVTGHDFRDHDDLFGFQRVDYEAIQHIPVMREAWVISLHAFVSTAYPKDRQDIPFFMLPALGGGSNLRGYSSWRFRDRNNMLLQAEWRIMVNRYIDTALFYDTGKVTARTSDLDFNDLKDDFGFGIRFHGALATPLRIDLAKSREGLSFVFSASAVF
jgi:hypothetical protein